MRTVNADGMDGQVMVWEALPVENRQRIIRILAQALAAPVPAERDDDGPDSGGSS